MAFFVFLFVVIYLSTSSAQYYPYPMFPYYPPPSHHQPIQQQPTYYIVQGPPPQPQPVYRTVEVDGDSIPSYAGSSPANAIAISAPPPQPPTFAFPAPVQPQLPPSLQYPGPTYIIASNYPYPTGAYPGGQVFQRPMPVVAPPYEKKQRKRVTSNRIS